jgi:hypothetical protein
MRKWIVAGIFLGVLVIAFAIFIIRLEEGPVPASGNVVATTADIRDIHFIDSYKSGVHTLKGRATLPSACTTLNATASIAEATTTVLRIDLSAPADTDICLQLPTEVSFATTVEGPADLPIDVYANGLLATSTP